MNNVILLRSVAVVIGLFLIFYLGLYYFGWDAIIDLIDYASCDWECVEKTEIAWGIFRLVPLFEMSLGLGVWVIILAVVRP